MAVLAFQAGVPALFQTRSLSPVMRLPLVPARAPRKSVRTVEVLLGCA